MIIDFSECKDEDKVGWACVIGADCDGDPADASCYPKANLTLCEIGSQDNEKCNDARFLHIDVESSALTLLLNMHDGLNINGDGNVCQGGVPGATPPGMGSDPDEHCLVEVDLGTCLSKFYELSCGTRIRPSSDDASCLAFPIAPETAAPAAAGNTAPAAAGTMAPAAAGTTAPAAAGTTAPAAAGTTAPAVPPPVAPPVAPPVSPPVVPPVAPPVPLPVAPPVSPPVAIPPVVAPTATAGPVGILAVLPIIASAIASIIGFLLFLFGFGFFAGSSDSSGSKDSGMANAVSANGNLRF